MNNVRDIYNYLNSIADFSLALDYDNVGLLVGDKLQRVTKVLLSLDINFDVADEAERLGAELIISHHPVIFEPLKTLNPDDTAYRLIKKGISAICAHTNLDVANGGINDVLTDILELYEVEPFSWKEEANVGRVGLLQGMCSVGDFAAKVKKLLNSSCVNYVDSKNPVNRVAVITGSGGAYINAAIAAEADTLLTGEAKYHQFLEAKQLGLNLVAAGHYATENIILPVLKENLQKAFLDIEFIISNENTEQPNTI